MVLLTVPASMKASSLGAATLTVPLVPPLAMVISSPVDRVTIIWLAAAVVRLAV